MLCLLYKFVSTFSGAVLKSQCYEISNNVYLMYPKSGYLDIFSHRNCIVISKVQHFIAIYGAKKSCLKSNRKDGFVRDFVRYQCIHVMDLMSTLPTLYFRYIFRTIFLTIVYCGGPVVVYSGSTLGFRSTVREADPATGA